MCETDNRLIINKSSDERESEKWSEKYSVLGVLFD